MESPAPAPAKVYVSPNDTYHDLITKLADAQKKFDNAETELANVKTELANVKKELAEHFDGWFLDFNSK